MSALSGLAMRTGCAVVGLTQPKGGSDPVTSAIGSTAWTAIPRIVWVLGADPDDESGQHRLCRVSKTNYREPANGIGFTIGNDEQYECGYVTRLAASTVSAEDLVAARQSDEDRSARDEARTILVSLLPMDAKHVFEATRAAGISDATVKRARKALGVTSTARRDPEKGTLLGWTLALPDHGSSPVVHPDQGPQGHSLIDPLEPLVPNREKIDTQRSRGSTGSVRPTGDSTPDYDDSYFLTEDDFESVYLSC